MFLGLPYTISGRADTRLRKTLAAALILSLCTLASVAHEARAQELPRERDVARQHNAEAKQKPTKAYSKATAGTTSIEAPPTQVPPAEMPPSYSEPAFEPPPEESGLPVFEPVPASDLAPQAPPSELVPTFEPVPTPESAPVPWSEPTDEPVGLYGAGVPADSYPVEDSGFIPVEGGGLDPITPLPTVDEGYAEPVPEASPARITPVEAPPAETTQIETPPAGTPEVQKPLVDVPPVVPAPTEQHNTAGVSSKSPPSAPVTAPVLSKEDKPLSPSLVKPLPSRSKVSPAPKPVVLVREARPLPPSPRLAAAASGAVKTFQNAATSVVGQVSDRTLLRPVDVDEGSVWAAVEDLFSVTQAALVPAGEFAAEDAESPPSGQSSPGGNAPWQPSSPFTLPPLGSSSFSLLPGGGEVVPGAASSLLLPCVLASGLLLLRWNGRLYRAWWDLPRPRSISLPALERPG